MTGSNEEENIDYIPLRMINEFVYCPRLFYLEYIEGYFEDSSDTIEGRIKHQRVDKESGELPDSDQFSNANDRIHATSVTLSSEIEQIVAKIDLIEGNGGEVRPVEYKKGRPNESNGGIWDSDKLQVTVQAMILIENGYNCSEATVYYAESNKKINLKIDDATIEWAKNIIKQARDLKTKKIIPDPLVDSPKCIKCSLVSICLPDETLSLKMEKSEKSGDEIRRLFPARSDSYPFYVGEQGAYISKKGEELVAKKDNVTIGSYRIMEISSVSIFGNVQISTQAIKELCNRNIPICYFSSGGWFTGMTNGISGNNIDLRIKQFDTASQNEKSLEIAKGFITGKIKNSRTMLRRNGKDIKSETLENLSELSRKILTSKNLGELLGIEGLAARIYFSNFTKMLKSSENHADFNFNSRNRRPPKDPVNAILSYLYSILAKDMTIIAATVGFDPYLGFLHKPKYGKPALALDLMEEFRPIICDSVVITALNSNEINKDDFIRRGNSVALTSNGRKKTIRAYERRLDDLISHPLFKYSVSYRRVFEVQARMLARYLNGEIKHYPVFTTR